MLQKLNDVARDAKESRALAEAERERASQLKVLLQQSLNCRTNDAVESTDDVLVSMPHCKYNFIIIISLVPWTLGLKHTKLAADV